MGFTKWILKNGPGSIGKTTKTCIQAYKDALKNQNEKDDEVKIASFTHVIAVYTLSTKLVQNDYYPTDSDLLLEASRGCLAMLCWVLICDDFKIVQAIWGSQKHFDVSTETVYETTVENSRSSIRMTYPEFRVHALAYIYYRVDANNYSTDNSGLIAVSVWYKTALINKHTREIEVFKNELLVDAKEQFDNLNEDYSPSIYIIWTIEVNNDKYKYVHYCNDKSYKDDINQHIRQTNGAFKFSGIDD